MRHKEAQKRPSICASTMSSAQYLNTCCKAFFLMPTHTHPLLSVTTILTVSWTSFPDLSGRKGRNERRLRRESKQDPQERERVYWLWRY